MKTRRIRSHVSPRKFEMLENRRVLATFADTIVFEGGLSRSQQVEAADIDGDGDMDAIAISGNGGVTLTNDGTANFGPIVPFQNPIGADARSLLVDDFDGDGDVDAIIGSIAGSEGDGTVTLHTNDGSGNFSLSATLLTQAEDDFIDGMGMGDLDGDGDNDVIAVGRGSSRVFLIYNEGNGTFGTPEVLTDAYMEPRSAHAADLDGDGDMDVLVASSFGEDDEAVNQMGWFENDNGTFTEKQVIDTFVEPRFMDSSDFDGDGDIDIVLPQQGDNTISYFENDGTGMLSDGTIIDTELTEVERVKAADLDSDGDDDIVASVDGSGVVVWYENDGSANFSSVQVISTDTIQASGLSIADLDADGDMDVLTSSQFHAKIDLHLNNGSQEFTQSDLTGPNVVDPDAALLADFDGDGDLDVLSQSDFDYKIAWYPNEGNNTYGQQVIVDEVDLNPGTTFWWDLDTADMNGDGHIDIVATFPTFLIQMAWYENDGTGNFDFDGSFHPIDAADAPPGPLELVVADMDGDGDSDIVVPEYFNSTVSWYENDGSGNLTARLIASIDIALAEVEVGDIDGDGDMDVLIGDNARYQARSVTWYEQVQNDDGSVIFDEVQIIETGIFEIDDVGLADMDGDGDLDALSASWLTDVSDSDIKWFENTDGKGTFGDAQIIGSQFEVVEFIAVDIEGDGDMDIISPNQNRNAVELFNNDGAGMFTVEDVAADLDGLGGLIDVGDVNGDGMLDFVLAESDANRIHAFIAGEDTGDPTDLNADGTTDLADVDLLCSGIRDMNMDTMFDLNEDGAVTKEDMIVMMSLGFGSNIGDSNVNGAFGTSDLIQVFQEDRFEQDLDANWGQGDWDCNGRFGTSDLVFAFQEGGFDPAAPAVPASELAAAVDNEGDQAAGVEADEAEVVAESRGNRGMQLEAIRVDQVFGLRDIDAPAQDANDDSLDSLS